MYNKVDKFSFTQQKIFWVLAFSYMYLVSVDPICDFLKMFFLSFEGTIPKKCVMMATCKALLKEQ